MDRIARIREMEAALDGSRVAVDQLAEAVAGLVDVLDDLGALSSYYGSQEWHADRKADERGKLPDDLARGVLSEDLAYDLLIDAREVALGALEASTALLRAL